MKAPLLRTKLHFVADSKVVALHFVEQRFPGALDGQRLHREQRAGGVDAICIATWSRLHAR